MYMSTCFEASLFLRNKKKLRKGNILIFLNELMQL